MCNKPDFWERPDVNIGFTEGDVDRMYSTFYVTKDVEELPISQEPKTNPEGLAITKGRELTAFLDGLQNLVAPEESDS